MFKIADLIICIQHFSGFHKNRLTSSGFIKNESFQLSFVFRLDGNHQAAFPYSWQRAFRNPLLRGSSSEELVC
jgi:hypothetical protein